VQLDLDRLSDMAIGVWKRSGMDTLLKVAPRGTKPDHGRPIGYCTTLKYVLGRTPAQMEDLVGLKSGSKLAHGAEVFTVAPLPTRGQFKLRGYTQCPGGVPTNDPGYVSHPLYPPGAGVPQWDLDGVPQSQLVWLASVGAGERFKFQLVRLLAVT